ncbi:MAG: hypothetical protein ACRDLD_15205, partial [Thermoleophilaceae bacterium]
LSWSGPARPPVWETRFPDGQSVRAELGTAGDQLLVYGDRARFHLSADLGTITCAARDEADPHCQRFLLDTVLWWLCLSRGQQVVHAGAVETERGVLAVAAATGAGKTTLCAELLRRGASLFSDDVLVVERGAGGPIAYPGPPLMNLPSEAGYPADFGRAIARFPAQAESWVAVERAAERPQPVAALFLLRRAPGLPLAAERREATVLDLLPHLWGLPHATEGPQERFQLASDLAATTPIYDLTADPEVPAATLADLVHGAVAGPVSEPILEGSAAR